MLDCACSCAWHGASSGLPGSHAFSAQSNGGAVLAASLAAAQVVWLSCEPCGFLTWFFSASDSPNGWLCCGQRNQGQGAKT